MAETLRPYPNLDREGINIPMDWDVLAKLIVDQNYGFLRMCAAMTRQARGRSRGRPTPLADAIENAIANGALE